RVNKPPEELIRFVAAPDGRMVPDLGRRLPGRGVWIEATRWAVAAAVRQNVFARSLKRPLAPQAELPAEVDRLLRQRLIEPVSLARRGGLVVGGFERVAGALGARGVAVLLHGAEAAPVGRDKLDRRFQALRGSAAALDAIIGELTSAELSLAIGRPSVVHAAAAEGGASQRLMEQARRLSRYRLDAGPRSPAHAHAKDDTGQA